MVEIAERGIEQEVLVPDAVAELDGAGLASVDLGLFPQGEFPCSGHCLKCVIPKLFRR